MMIVSVDVKDKVNQSQIRHLRLKYVASSDVSRISYNEKTETIIIGIGERTDKSTFMRDIGNDVFKGIGCIDAKEHKKHNWRLKEIKSIEFVGSGSIEELTIANVRYEVRIKRVAQRVLLCF